MNKWKWLYYLFVPGLCLWLAWPPIGIFVLLFVGFVPLLQLQEEWQNRSGIRWWMWLYGSLFFWNLFTTWWVWNSTLPGAVAMLVLNSLFMTIPWMLYRYSRKKLGDPAVYLFVIFWLTYEYLHHRWDLSWPWLTLGNGLASAPWLVQWYDITGTLGGSAFVLAMNVLIWKAWKYSGIMKNRPNNGMVFFFFFMLPPTRKAPFWRNHLLLAMALFLFVLASSLFNAWKWERTVKPDTTLKVAVCQPSYDPWTEKFARPSDEMVTELINLSKPVLDKNTYLLVWPETSLTSAIDVDHIRQHSDVASVAALNREYPSLNILTGADMQQVYENCRERPNGTARPTQDPTLWWNAYNSALLIGSGPIEYYHKSILVPGTEQMPFVQQFSWIDKLAVQLDDNSISGSLGKSPAPKVFNTGKIKAAPIICYESIYGDYTGRFVKDSADVLCVITNDAWWGNTPGYKQHLAYAGLRAIEHRRWLVRSANTGISGFINPYGEVVKATEWWEKTALSQEISIDSERRMTLYTRMGDLAWLMILGGLSLSLGIAYYLRLKTRA
jgi:apolipoprotein N-acyltransferase